MGVINDLLTTEWDESAERTLIDEFLKYVKGSVSIARIEFSLYTVDFVFYLNECTVREKLDSDDRKLTVTLDEFINELNVFKTMRGRDIFLLPGHEGKGQGELMR